MSGLATAGRRLEEMAQLGLQMEEDGVSGEHMKAMWAGQSNVLVSVRVRPLMKHDVVKKSCVRVLDSKVVVIMDPATGDKQDILRANRNREKQYAFDYVFEPGSSQESCYHHTTKFLIHGVLDGFNATVFAYGQTGSGKTYTMIGTPSDPGIMVRVMSDLFVHSATQGKQQGVHYKVTVSFLEVYNENIRDLLSDVEEYLDLREDPIKGPVVASITEIETTSSQEVMQLLLQGNAKRSQAATAANEVSSRSHAVLQVVVENRDRAPGTVANIKLGKLSLVDLAGSERAANTKNVGARLVEGANINRSLLALGNCINALGEKGNKGNFVPYRDSKLTRLLKDSLGGNCRTVMIANISCAESSFEETLNTLKYANRAKNIKTHVQRNVLNVNYHISEYVQLINNLRNEIQVLKGQIGSTPAQVDGGLHDHSAAPVSMQPTPSRQKAPSTPFQVLRESMRSAHGLHGATAGEGRELVNNMRERIVENFQERMQLRRSLIELEDQNVQNSIEVSKRQLIVVQWSETHGNINRRDKNGEIPNLTKADFAADILANGTSDIVEAWQECEQLRKAILKNNGMKKNIAKRLRHNEREAEKFRDELGDKITGEDRRELMELQYQVGRLELENMELEQHRIVHESILKGKDLIIQKLKLQLAVRDKLIQRQQNVLQENDLDNKVGYSQLALLEQTLMGDMDFTSAMAPPSPPRNMSDINNNNFSSGVGAGGGSGGGIGFVPADMMLHSIDSVSHSGAAIGGAKHRRHGSTQDSTSSSHHNVPRLSMPGGNNHNRSGLSTLEIDPDADNRDNNDDEDEDVYSDGYEAVPVTERGEVALSSRDRDIIEQGDWSEINNEIVDNSFDLLGKVPSTGGLHKHSNRDNNSVANAHNAQLQPQQGNKIVSNPITRNNSNANSNSSLNNAQSSNTKGVHGPRGGRQFRSSALNTCNDEGVQQNVQSARAQPVPQFRNKSLASAAQSESNFTVDDSDNDSVNSNVRGGGGGGGGGRQRASRHVVDKLDPIPLVPAGYDEGVLSGRRYDNHNNNNKDGSNNSRANRDLTPRNDRNNSNDGGGGGGGGYAPVYPSLFSKDGGNREYAGKAGGGVRTGAGVSNSNYSNNGQAQPAYRRNSRGLTDDESTTDNNGAVIYPSSGLNDLNIGGRGFASNNSNSNSNVPSGIGGILKPSNKLSKLKIRGNSNSSLPLDPNSRPMMSGLDGVSPAHAAASGSGPDNCNNNNSNNLFSVHGNGFGNNSSSNNSNLGPVVSPANAASGGGGGGAKPTNKLKPSRKLIQKSVSSAVSGDNDNGGGGLSVDGVGSEALLAAGAVGSDVAMGGGRNNRSLPNLPKQLHQPNSARRDI